jgi:type II secretory pathway pseudopilin PulG
MRSSARGGERRNERGMSLVEATVILATLSALTAAMAPAVGNYLNSAQQATAKKDVETLGSAIAQMLNDTGEGWIVRDGNGASATAVPSHASANRVDLLVSNGTVPTLGVARATAGTDWTAAVDNAATQSLANYLVLNTPSNLAANAYRSAANMSVTTSFDPDAGGFFNSPQAWRGAYLPGPIGPDPWGTRYAVNVEFLARAPGASSGSVNDVIVLSPGDDGRIDTRFDIDGVTSGSDVFYVLSGSSR